MNIQKEIASVDINDSKGEALVELNQTLDFSKELEKYNITDLENSRLTIKNDGKKYIFAIDGQNAFCVGGKNTFEQIVKEFYSQQTTEEINLVLERTTLKVSILKNTNITANYQESNIEKPIDILTIQNRIDAYKEFFKAQVDDVKRNAFWLSYNTAGKEKSGYKITKEVAKSQLRILENMEKRLQKLQKTDRYTPENQGIATQELAITLPEFSKQLDAFERSAPEFVAFQNDIVLEKSDITSFDLRGSINNIAGAQRVLGILEKFNRQELRLTQTTLELAKQQEYARDLLSLEKYLQKVIADGNFDPSVLQFTARHQAAMNYLASDSTINGLLNNKNNADVNTVIINDPKLQEEYNKLTAKEKAQYTDRKDAFAKGGINGLTEFGLDQTKMSPEQKETWKGVGNLAVTGGLIFLGWKAISTAFKALSKSGRKKLNEEGDWGWLWLPVAGTLASNMLTGESPLALLTGGKGTEYLTGLFGGKKDSSKEQNQAVDTYTKGFGGISAIFGESTCGQMANSLEIRDNKMKLKPNFVNDIISLAKNNPSDTQKVNAAEAIQLIGEDDPNGLIHMTLISMGLSYDALKNIENADKPFKERAAGAIARLASVVTYMKQNGYNRINSDQLSAIQDYIAKKDGKMDDLDTLQKRLGDVFEDSAKAPDEATKEQRKQKVNTLALTDTEKQELLSSIRSFWMERPLAKDLKQFDIQQKGGYIEFTTYGKTTKIDIKNKTIVGLEDVNKSSIRFQSTFELLKVANLTNRIFDLVKNNQNPVTKDPFEIHWIGEGIKYDNTKFWSNPFNTTNHFDTTMISGGPSGMLKEISPILEKNKKGYLVLLNAEYNRINKLK